jgi:UDP-N-acetylglucosamine 2-epimerase (non-hydrolysing)
MEKIIFIFGTRPEAIKMAPVIRKFQHSASLFKPVIIVTAQHREMLDQILKTFQINPDYDLNIMQKNQSLEDITICSLKKLTDIIRLENSKMILTQGDTTTTFVGALAGFYNKILVGHIEAGLRTYDKFQPFPEEMNRKLTTALADIHFAPTKSAAESLKKEGVPQSQIFVTGNTVIDALLEVVSRRHTFRNPLDKIINKNKRLILVTAHRRESFGNPLKNICSALKELVQRFNDVQILFPVHPNPKVHNIVFSILNNDKKIYLSPPLDYETFAHIMTKAYLILTDSGGIQEEAPSLGKPVLVLRDKTERPEAVEAGTVKLVGTSTKKILQESSELLENQTEYNRMATTINPYGDGRAAERIVNIIHECLSNR